MIVVGDASVFIALERINASAAGVIETARANRDRIGKVYAGRNGIIGALTIDFL